MNVLPIEKQIQIVTALVEGNSVRATARMVGVEHKTVMRVLLRVGDRCACLLNERMRPVEPGTIGEICVRSGTTWLRSGDLADGQMARPMRAPIPGQWHETAHRHAGTLTQVRRR